MLVEVSNFRESGHDLGAMKQITIVGSIECNNYSVIVILSKVPFLPEWKVVKLCFDYCQQLTDYHTPPTQNNNNYNH